MIEAWSSNETTASCQNKTVGGSTAGLPTGHLYYGMICPFVNTTIAGWIWWGAPPILSRCCSQFAVISFSSVRQIRLTRVPHCALLFAAAHHRYQGENNVGGFHDSSPGSAQGGYSCMQARMVAAWRKIWSVSAGTTEPLAPFGLVTIAPSGSEGHGKYLSAFRWAQTANYGVLPNPAMPRTFVAQAYDLNDPWCELPLLGSVCQYG
jgi:hypothetical protein